VILRAATADDFDFIRALTTDPANAPFIGDDDMATLASHLQSEAKRLLIWGDRAGFALFCGVGAPSHCLELFRLALAQTGGQGSQPFLAALLEYGFETLQAQRIWLDVSGENIRAQRAYARAGFVKEGHLRAHWYRPALGRNVDLLLFGMLRAEWARLHR
jgi:ribosomal protein S18 acetylase RimI-like enzyme